MRGTEDTEIEFDNIPVIPVIPVANIVDSSENTDNLPIVDAYQSIVVVSEEFTELCFDQRLQAPAALKEVFFFDPMTNNLLIKLGAKQDQIDNLPDDDLKKFSTYKKILKKFGVFGLNFDEIKTFSVDRLEKFSKHLSLFNDLKEYMDKMTTWIDEDKANEIKHDMKNFIVQSNKENLKNLISSLKKKSELTHPFFYTNRLSCVFSERGSHLADRIRKDFIPLLNNGQPVKRLCP